MKREIKFEVRRDDTKEIIGYERIGERGQWEHKRINRDEWLLGAITDRQEYSKFMRRQYVGRKDKKEIEVYSGDFDSDGNVVVWCENCNGWEFGALDIPTNEICIPCHRCDGNFFFEDHINDFEVIGNICQN